MVEDSNLCTPKGPDLQSGAIAALPTMRKEWSVGESNTLWSLDRRIYGPLPSHSGETLLIVSSSQPGGSAPRRPPGDQYW